MSLERRHNRPRRKPRSTDGSTEDSVKTELRLAIIQEAHGHGGQQLAEEVIKGAATAPEGLEVYRAFRMLVKSHPDAGVKVLGRVMQNGEENGD